MDFEAMILEEQDANDGENGGVDARYPKELRGPYCKDCCYVGGYHSIGCAQPRPEGE